MILPVTNFKLNSVNSLNKKKKQQNFSALDSDTNTGADAKKERPVFVNILLLLGGIALVDILFMNYLHRHYNKSGNVAHNLNKLCA